MHRPLVGPGVGVVAAHRELPAGIQVIWLRSISDRCDEAGWAAVSALPNRCGRFAQHTADAAPLDVLEAWVLGGLAPAATTIASPRDGQHRARPNIVLFDGPTRPLRQVFMRTRAVAPAHPNHSRLKETVPAKG